MHTVNESESIGGNICEELQGVLKSKTTLRFDLFSKIIHFEFSCFILFKDTVIFLTNLFFYALSYKLFIFNIYFPLGCDFVSHSLFKDILQRKDDCDAKRNVLNVLHRYRFLFNLPRSIEKSIQQVLFSFINCVSLT